MTKTKSYALLAIAFISISLCGIGAPPAFAQLSEAALGVWADEDGEAWIEIAPCQDKLCGRIVWLKEPLDETGQPHTDKSNPDPALQPRPILGLTIMAGLQPNAEQTYLEGQVYNSRNGKIYDVYLTPRGQTMDVEGCLVKYVCLTQRWTRVK
ncbi:MAG: DUF2147 domain-containing protein [Anderseniella sp.]|jgi:uncharacterized protein (DUF2147 family)|nr:DUF2147 domain-containing protein [Anderseniella sp.]